ncbi:MAG: hypothetical protein ACK4RK_00340 [Gemmataceae bacterium]
MYIHPFKISLDTLIASSPLLGHFLEDRTPVRESQDIPLLRKLQEESTVSLRDKEQRSLFCVAPFDILVSEINGEKQFHLIEINGTGIGGLTNLSSRAVGVILENLTDMAQTFREPDALVLVAISGKESDTTPRLNRLMHEKILYLEALKNGFELNWEQALVFSLPQLAREPGLLQRRQPTVVLGYTKEFLKHLSVDERGGLRLFGRHVNGAVNDRFCLNILQYFNYQVDLRRLVTMNRCFFPGADKGCAYGLLNEYLSQARHPFMPSTVRYQLAHDRDCLIVMVLDWLRQGRKAVIKPSGTGLGHGIEFFLSATEPVEHIIARIDESIDFTQANYLIPGGAFPYTVCEYIDTCTIRQHDHPLHKHKYELRIVVYRDGMELKAFPSIAKVSSKAYDETIADRLSLINNITTSAVVHQRSGMDFMLPLTNCETLSLLDLRVEHLRELCLFCTNFMRFVLDVTQFQPGRVGLPETARPLPPPLPQGELLKVV